MARLGQTLSPEELYLRIRQVIADMPELYVDSVTSDLAKWLGEAAFLISECGDIADAARFTTATHRVASIASDAPHNIPIILYRALARAEARAPSSAHGTFIAAGKPFDALAAVSKLFGEAKSDVLIADPYAEANLLAAFLLAVPEQVPTRVLADAKSLKPTLKPATEAWVKQFAALRPLEVRVAPKGMLHDRLIFLNRSVVWVLGQSFNQLATRSHTSLMKADAELAKLKVNAYETIWSSAIPL